MLHQRQGYKSKGRWSVASCKLWVTCQERGTSYSEVFKHKAVEEVGITIPQVAEVDVFLDRGSL
jgi:hypothetical protein